MISLKQSMDAQEQGRRLAELANYAIKAWQAAMEGIRDHALRACPPVGVRFEQPLLELVRKVEQVSAGHQATDLSRQLSDLLARFGEEATKEYTEREDEIREVVRLVARVKQDFAARSNHGSQEFTQFADHVETAAEGQNLAEIRSQLKGQVRMMRETIQRLVREDDEMIRQLEAELDLTRQRLEVAEELAYRDSLTQLANRRGLERQLRTRVDRRETFCLILFDLDRFKMINDRYGHVAGDMVLVEFAKRLSSGIRSTDLACRWAGDEFILVLSCQSGDALTRSQQIYQRVRGRYVVRPDDKELRIEVTASMGVAEHKPGDSLERLMARADALLYANKSQQ